MAKQKGFIKIEGTLGDTTFYKTGDSYLIREKGGVSGDRIKNDPAFKRTRENINEFSTVATAGKLLRGAAAVLTKKAYDGKLTQRMMRVMTAIKNADQSSDRGYRQIYKGLETEEGIAMLRGFNFNGKSSLTDLLLVPYVVEKPSGKVTVDNLVPADMLNFPPASTHVAFQAAILDVDFETGLHAIAYSQVENFPLDMVARSFTLTPTEVPAGTGTKLYLMLVEFYQEVNGSQYALNNGGYNALTVLEVE